MLIQQKLNEYLRRGSLSGISQEIGVDPRQIKILLHYSSAKNSDHKFTLRTLDAVYDFFGLERDRFYLENLSKWNKPTEAILGTIFRRKRISMWRSLEEVARKIKWDVRQLRRIECWESLPSYKSYYITQLIALYGFTLEEQATIRRFICILSDLVKINNKYDLENVESE